MFTTTLAFPFTYDEISTFCNDKAFIITENANAQKDISAKCHPERSASVVEGFGAEMLITACPLCLYNLNKSTCDGLPVYYFTELLAEALGVKEEAEMEVAKL